MIGQLLDRRYLITQRLSSGGFGETYLAQDTRIPGNPLCVVKQLKPASDNPSHIEKARQLFNREAEALAKLGSYEQIPRLLAYFTEGDEFYLVQEFIEGHTLEAELQPEQRWSEEQVIHLLKEVLTTLTYVHAQGVIHRDIKPANIIRRRQDDKLVLIDFGAIKQVRIQPDGSGEFSVAAPGTRIGTVGYMPTEQARGKPRPCSDLYALGMIAIQALTGLHPTQLEDDSQTGEVRWQHLVKTNPRLIEFLNHMTRYQFRNRFQTASEALQALQLLTQPGSYSPTPAIEPTLVPEQVHELTLVWQEAGQANRRVIYPQQPSRNPGTIRIGRDPARCDLVLSDITVSGLHVEIFFNAQDRNFYVRNLRETNPPLINGQALPRGEQRLHQGSTIRLGQVELVISSIALRQYPPGQSPLSGTHSPTPPPEPLVPTAKSSQDNGVPYPPPNVPIRYRVDPVQPVQPSPSPTPYQQPPYQQGAANNFYAASPAPSPYSPSPYSPVEATHPPKMQPSWNFWVLWVIATIVSFSISGIIFSTARGFIAFPGEAAANTVANLLIGAIVGLAQWLVLRSVISRSEWWILTSSLGLLIGSFIAQPFPLVIHGLVVGIVLGVAQWLVLRTDRPQAQAGVWVVVQAVCYLGLWSIPVLADALIPRLILGSLLYGAITGGMLTWLLRQPPEVRS